MAGFGDDNDIKINVTLDTEAAIKSAQELKVAIESSLKVTEQQFNKIKQVATQLSSALDKLAKAEVSGNKEKLNNILSAEEQAAKKEIAIAEDAASKKAKAAQKAASLALEAEKARIRELETLARQEADREKTRRTQLLKDIAQLNKDRAVIRKTPRAELPSDLGGVSGAGKLLDALGKSAAGIGVQFGNVNVVVGTLLRNLVALGGPVGTATAALAILKFGLDKFNASIDETAQTAGKLEGLKTGFETLQRSIGQAPLASINRLREATQGLISDTDLYQRANQAVLLGVPTETFNQAAAAAVKLGRAMGIDASFGLESLSLGLGRQSRLYLDNLGIVVSAEEAYRNFGLTVGKSAADLSDAEKKAAFFAEALKKIKERADELPDPIDSAAIAQQKANVAQENANQQYLEGFNASKNLAEQYAIQRANTEAAAKSAYIYGAAFAELGAVAKGVANGLATAGVIFKTGFGEALDFVFRFSPEKKIADLNGEIADTSKRIEYLKTTIPATGELGLIARSNKAEIERLNQSLAEKQKALDTLKATLNELDGKNVNIKIAIDGIEAAQSQISTLFADLGKKAEQEAGIFKIAGLPDVEAAKVFSEYKKAKEDFDNSLNKTEALETYKNALKGIEQQVAGGAIKESAKQLASNIDALAGAVSSGDFKNAKNIFGNIAKGVVDVSKAARTTTVSLKDLEAGVSGVNGQIKKNATVNKNTAKDAVKAVKQQETAWDNFLKKLNRELDTAIDPDIQIKLAEAFRTSEVGSQELIDKLKELGAEVIKRKGDIDALTKAAGEFAEVAQQGGPILNTGAESKAALSDLEDAQKELKQIQAQSLNIRSIFTDAEGGGGFFGFDIGLGPQNEAALASSVSDAVQLGLNLAFEKFTRDDAPQIAGQIGSVVGAGIGAALGGPAGAAIGGQIGGTLGTVIGEVITRNTQDLASTKERKKIDAAFAELFDGERLGIVIEGEIFTATQKRKKGNLGAIGAGIGAAIGGAIGTAVGGAIGIGLDDALNTVGEQAKKKIPPTFVQLSDIVFEGFTRFAGDVRFGSEEASKGFNAFSSYFNTLPDNIRASFNGVGLAFGELLGVAGEQARLIGVALANNIGGSLQNLQVLVQQTGKSFDELAQSVLKGFLDSQLTIEEAYNSLVQLQSIYEVGIPGAIGAWEEAIDNLNNVLQSDRPGRYAIDSLRDIGAEGAEAKKTFDSVVASLSQTFGFAADQQSRLFEALRINGITSLEQLAKASDEQLLAILRNVQLIKENAQAPLVTTPQISSTPKAGPSASRGQSPEDKRKEALKRLREETQKLLRDSIAYEEIVQKINSGELTRIVAGAQIIKLQEQVQAALKRRNDLEKQYEDELNKGSKANKKRLADLAAQLDQVNNKIKGFTEEAKAQFKGLNIAGIVPLIKSANSLGVVSKLIGVDLEKATDILTLGFLRGKLSIQEFNEQLKKTRDNLGKGIPGEVGAVTKAFQNLVDAGTRGGQFSVDAFTDIFAEFREKFQKEGSAIREQQRQELLAALEDAKAAAATAVGPEATSLAQKALDAAKKALEDFYGTIPAPNLSDLRSQLEQSFGVEQIAKFFRAIDESGIRTFDDLEKAGVDGILPILSRLQELGFQFNETSDEIKGINEGLNNASNAANGNKDPIQAALDLIKQFNEGATSLPPAFNSTTEAVNGLSGTLTQLNSDFNDILDKLAKLSGQSFSNEIVFNVRTEGDTSSKALVDILFGDGAGANAGIGNGGTGGGGGGGGGGGAVSSNDTSLARKKRRLQFLEKNGRSNSAEAKRLRREIGALGG